MRPPQPSLMQALGSMLEPLDFFSGTLRAHPDLFFSGLFGFQAFVVHNPNVVRQVLYDNASNYRNSQKHEVLKFLTHNGLVTNQGESWLRQRRLVQPAFKPAPVQNLKDLIETETALAMRVIEGLLEQGRPININALMGELTIGIISKALFSTQAGPHAQTIRHELDVCQRMGNLLLRAPWRWPEWTPQLPVFRRFKTAIARLDAIVHGLIDERRKQIAAGIRPNDLLDALIHASDPEHPTERMTDTQLRDEVLTLFLVGHETTLLALSWTFEQLAWNQDVQSTLRTQLQASGGAPGTQPPYLEWVLNESMRLRPPVYIVARQAIEADDLMGFEVAAGMNVLVNVYGLHRHPRHWIEPERFWPERFDGLDLGALRHTFLPFGAGPRQCIGAHLAMLEMRTIVAAMLRHFVFEPSLAKPVKPSPMITLKTARDITLKARRV